MEDGKLRAQSLLASATSPAAPLRMSPLYLVDGFNFLHAVVLKGQDRANWWSPEHQARVVARVTAQREALGGAEVWVVFDQRGPRAVDTEAGPAPMPVPAPGGEATPLAADRVDVRHAPDADDYIVACCAELAGAREVVVVSADRSLCDRARSHGARRVSPWAFAR